MSSHALEIDKGDNKNFHQRKVLLNPPFCIWIHGTNLCPSTGLNEQITNPHSGHTNPCLPPTRLDRYQRFHSPRAF